MNQANPGDNPDAPADFSVKRKRGRPRKHPSINQGVNDRLPRDQSLNHSGFDRMNGHKPRHVEPDDDRVDNMIGQVVSGVIEASFDAGYLLNVRVGNSETTLRGVVFKQGHYVPVSIENDVAPDARMIRRHKTPLPTENYSRVHASHRNKTRRTFSDSAASSEGKQVPSVAPQDPNPSNVSTFDEFVSESQSTRQEVPRVTQNENGAEIKSLEMSGMPMEKLLAEVIKRGQVHSQSAGTSTSTGKVPSKDSDTFGSTLDEPLFIEPLRAVQPHQHNHSASATRPLEKEGIGRMTELLQVVQDKMTENQTLG